MWRAGVVAWYDGQREEASGVAATRDATGRFLPGNKMSPGRKKLPEEFKARAKVLADEALERLGAIMRDPEAKHSDVIRACEILIERAYGKCVPANDEDAAASVLTVRLQAGPQEWNE